LGRLAFDQLISHAETAHFLLESQGTEYLAFSTRLHSIFSTDWIIIVVAPLSDFLSSIISTQHQVLLFLVAILLVSSFIVIYFSKKISSPIATLSKEIEKISQFDLSSQLRVKSTINELSLLDQAINTMRHVVQSFARYVPKEVVKNLCQNHQEIVLGGQKQEVTIFLSDISNFTSITESQPIDELLSLLSEYFDVMTKVLLSLNGTIDKFIGDGIMAFWGAPLYMQDHASKACDAALLCQAELKNLNRKRKQENKPEFLTRFGIHTGPVIVGNIGTKDRMNYTIIGDAVNTAVRLQEVDKIYHTSILISEDVYHKLGPDYIARPLDIVLVKGKVKTIKIYELLGKLHAEPHIAPTPEEITLCRLFTTAYEAMQQKQFLAAKGLFASIANQFPDDFPTQIYLKRVTEFLQAKRSTNSS
jgi:adenylate cyclase